MRDRLNNYICLLLIEKETSFTLTHRPLPSPAVCAQLAYIRSLGVGAVVLEGLFLTGASPDGPVLNDSLLTGPQVDHLLKESSKAGE